MNELEKLRAQLNQIVDAIIAEAKKQTTTAVPSPSNSPIEKIDLSQQINNTFNTVTSLPIKDKPIFSGYVDPLKWIRNNNCWAKTINFLGTTAGILGLGGVGGGTLITRKHILLANHVPYPALPFLIYFVDSNNVTYEYKVVKTSKVVGTDILIGELDRETDSVFPVYSVLPANFSKYFSDTTAKFPVIYSDQEKKALVGEFNGLFTVANCGTNAQIIAPSTDARRNYFEPLRVGDSGNPVFTIINNELVLLGSWFQYLSETSGVCTLLPNYINEVNNTIASFGNSNYKLKIADLNIFKQF